VITTFAVALLVPFSAVIATQMRRIEGRHEVLATTQVTSGAVLSLEFIIPVMIWLTAAFRPSAVNASMIRLLDDMGWLMFVAVNLNLARANRLARVRDLPGPASAADLPSLVRLPQRLLVAAEVDGSQLK
jgi:hypothetical protein